MDLSFLVTYDLLPWQWAAWIAMGISIGFTKAGLSGSNVVMVPAVAMIFGAKESTGLVLPLLCFADVLAVLYYKSQAEWKYILRLLPWTLAGFAAAVFVEKLVPARGFKYLMGCCLLVGLAMMIWNDIRGGEKTPPSRWWVSALFGIAGGFCATIGNVAGAVVAIYLLSMRLPKAAYIGTTAWFFFIINSLRLPIQIFLWNTITVKTFLFDLTLIPVIIASTFLGIFLIKKISAPVYRKIIILITLLSTIFLFV